VIEVQIDVVVLIGEFAVHLAPDEREPHAHLQQESLDVIDQRLLHLALAARIGRAEEVEHVRILEHLGGQVRLGRRQRRAEVGERWGCPVRAHRRRRAPLRS
jgi:hypothetical protein